MWEKSGDRRIAEFITINQETKPQEEQQDNI